ncbi:PTS sugar transporter subunit IIC [Cetobacterium sp. 2G large]|uniref:PTS sugar transporter subunit IIC n=1 Tax=Cetobacterium sp. 2G large TaxID=2759680 RepID=UPI00163C2884|nr:PTS transporter subunit EIIC [Cetobacterium sp. 2G large]MBC2854506.1 PTS sugar transporter subunit IIC [Cetobacterium sp. 2G large]
MGLFEKFESIIKKILVPIAEKIDKQPHLTAVKKGMVVLTPILLLGSMAYPLKTLKNIFASSQMVQDWFANNVYLIDLLIKFSLGFVGVYAVIAISYFLSERYKIYTVGAVTLSLFSFLVTVTNLNKDGSLDIKYFDSKGLFTAIFIALITVEIYKYFTDHKLVIKMPEGVPDFVSRSFELITPTAFIAIFFISLRYLVSSLSGGMLLPEVIMKVLAPAIGSMDNLFVVWFVIMLRLMFWFFGIHSAVLSPVLSPIFVQYLAENIAAKEAGLPLPHFATGGVFSAFVNFTGSGVTMGLVLAMLFGKTKRYKKVAQVSLIPGLFGINEPILFGGPVILNPILFIPFVFGSSLISLMPLALMKYGFLAKPFFDPPYLPLFFEGFLTGFDWKAPFVQIVQLILSFLVYYPFFKVLEKEELKSEAESKKIHEIFTQEDNDILEDLELDF